MDALALFWAEFLGEELFGLTHIGSPGQMGQDDVFILQLGQQLNEVVDVNMLAETGPVLVILFEKCAFNDEDRGLTHHIRPFKPLELDIAKIAQNGNLCSSSDFFALIFLL